MTQSAAPPAPQGGPPGRPNVQDILGFVRRYIPLSTRFLSGQKSGMGQYVTATFTLTNTDTSFTLALGHIPSGYVITRKSSQGQLIDGSNGGSDWTPNKIVLRSTTATTYHLYVF